MSELQEYHRQEKQRRKRRQFTVTLPGHIGEYIEQTAKEEGVPKSTVVEFALRKAKERGWRPTPTQRSD